MKLFSFTTVFIFILSITSELTNTESKRIITMTDKHKNLSMDFATIGDTTFSFIEPEEVNIELFGDVYNEPEIEMSIDKYQWGLDRIDQESLPLDKKNYNPKYSGKNVDVYVLDTGVDIYHPEFENRASVGISYYGSSSDQNGHGTHVASTVAGKTVGVAPDANIISVKVLSDSGSGSTINVIKGIEWAVNNYKKTEKCSIISMSLGGGKSTTLDRAVQQAYRKGVITVVAAGNSNNDAKYYSPASAANAITVGSIDEKDQRSYFSNYGKLIDIFAPGSNIIAAKSNSNKYSKKSGTSMAAPHVSGAVAQIMENIGCKNRNNVVKRLLSRYVIEGKLDKIPSDTDNLLLQIPEDNSENDDDDNNSCDKLPCWVKCLMKETRDECETDEECRCFWKESRKRKCQIKN